MRAFLLTALTKGVCSSPPLNSDTCNGGPTEAQGGAVAPPVAGKSHGCAGFAPLLSSVLKGVIKAHLVECDDLRPPEIANGKLHD
ncbi:hypothetical protein L3X38_018393 [Prunus dulcis]|uniref:Secreted protein n=1 Tax=Prunus dulcis TaxID=3755 RepID=A0AAD4WBH6_PRUDU|nr:hypothetical protein L3X38_018393 [Prunus dulcis]